MNEITRDVILDLLPLYLAGEVSEDTARLVKKYLESDPELAEIAQEEADFNLLEKIPVPITKEKNMEKFIETKKWLMTRTILLNLIMAVSFAVIFICMFLTLLASKYMETMGSEAGAEILGKFLGL
jgi:uncharacterized membrane protein